MPTEIQWTDETWNPVTGCTRVSPGCANCYIERTPPFRMARRRFATIGGASTTGVRLHPDRLEQPLHWCKPRRVFVCSLADLFHDDVPDEFIWRVWMTMAEAETHTFQVLTKRPERARDLLRGWNLMCWALPNVWLGVSIENARYTWRADVLREIPSAVRFISAEPLLGSLFEPRDLEKHPLTDCECNGPDAPTHEVCLECGDATPDCRCKIRKPLDLTGIDWIIVGGESGPGARPFDIEHAREIIAAARGSASQGHSSGAGVRALLPGDGATPSVEALPGPAVFVKQLGSRPFGRGGALTYVYDRKGGDPDEWPADLRIREFPQSAA